MASAPRHGDVSRVNWAPQVKPDQWGPLVSDTVLVCVADGWDQVNDHVSGSMLTRGSTHFIN